MEEEEEKKGTNEELKKKRTRRRGDSVWSWWKWCKENTKQHVESGWKGEMQEERKNSWKRGWNLGRTSLLMRALTTS